MSDFEGSFTVDMPQTGRTSDSTQLQPCTPMGFLDVGLTNVSGQSEMLGVGNQKKRAYMSM